MHTNLDKNLITGLVLAGGQGSRMGNVDKGLQDFKGAPMVSHVLRRLSPQVGTLIVNANRNLSAYQSFGLPVHPDNMAGFSGPLAGLQSGLIHCATPYLVTVPCDSPLLPADLVARLSEALQAAQADLTVAVTDIGETRQLHPVFCLLRASLLPQLNTYLENGGRKVDAWFKQLNTVEVTFPDETAFCNINTPDELAKFENLP